ncbi:MAG TPA: hypothetical protein VFR36_02535 [Sphingomicrobium sp.]|nr:hypothetical protein [Sphingomicrobium sp.]
MVVTGVISLAAALAAPNLSSATGDWSNIPAVERRNNSDATAFIVDAIESAVQSGNCKISGVSGKRINLEVPFLIQFDTSGAVKEVVVGKLGCPEVEIAMGNAILRLAERGDYRPSGRNDVGWYRGLLDIDSN